MDEKPIEEDLYSDRVFEKAYEGVPAARPREVSPSVLTEDSMGGKKTEGSNRHTTSCCMVAKGNLMSYADVSSMHGIPYFAGSLGRNVACRLIWFVLFIATIATSVIIFYPILKSYMDNEVSTSDHVTEVKQFKFPGITFCNFNVLRKSFVGQSYNYSRYKSFAGAYVPDITPDRIEAEKEYCTAYEDLMERTLIHQDESDMLYASTASPTVQYRVTRGEISTANNLFAGSGFLGHMLFSHDAYQSVMNCSFSGQRMPNEKCFDAFVNRRTSENFCFTFNSLQDTLKPLDDIAHKIQASEQDKLNLIGLLGRYPPENRIKTLNLTAFSYGPANAFEMTLNAQQSDYCGLVDSVGFKMYVHSADVEPINMQMSQDFYQLGPGKLYTLFIEESRKEMETERAGRCTSHVDLKYYKHLKTYQQEACLNECFIEKISTHCNCLPATAPTQALTGLLANMSFKFSVVYEERLKQSQKIMQRICLSTKQLTCVEQKTKQQMTTKTPAEHCPKCLPACKTSYYVTSLTESDLTSENNKAFYANKKTSNISDSLESSWSKYMLFTSMLGLSRKGQKVQQESASSYTDNELKSINDNLLKLRIQIKSFSVKVQVETFATSFSELLAQLGGALGLCIGVSVLTIAEFIHWSILCCCKVRQ